MKEELIYVRGDFFPESLRYGIYPPPYLFTSYVCTMYKTTMTSNSSSSSSSIKNYNNHSNSKHTSKVQKVWSKKLHKLQV